jgi:AcrR family transcriptional regulator
MATIVKRETYRHGNVRSDAIRVGLDLVRASGHEALSVRQVATALGVAHRSLYNHFADRETYLDAIAEEGFIRFGESLKGCRTPTDYVRAYVEFALRDPLLYDLLQSRPHGTMKEKPSLRAAVHIGLTEALRLFSKPGRDSDENRRAVMKVLILLNGGISMHRSGILDVPDDAALVAELQAMIETEN